MIRAGALAAMAVALSACSPAPRTADYFKVHPDVAARVLAGCAAGRHGGPECKNAQVGDDQRKSDARLALYRKSF